MKPAQHKKHASSRWKIVGWMLLTTSIAISGLVWSVRGILLADVERVAIERTVHEIGEFRQFAEIGVDPETGKAFESAETMLMTYISRQYSGYTEQIIGVTPSSVLYLKEQDDHATETGYRFHHDRELLKTISNHNQSSGVAQTPAGPIKWGKVNIRVDSAQEPTGQLIVVEYMHPDLEQVRHTINTMVGVGLGALALTVLVSWIIAGQITKPIRNLQTVAAEISEKDITGRVPVKGNDDVAAMSKTFNQMLDRIEDFSTEQKEFLDDVSHELRTPITIVRGHLELMERNPEQDATIQLVVDELDRMGRIVGDLLLLAKSERPDFIHPEPCDVADLMIALDSKVQAFTKHRWVMSEIAEGTVILDQQRITQALVQYCANAAQYSPEGSLISLGTNFQEVDGARYLDLWVQDAGPGVAAEDAPYLFDRFKRSHSKNPATAQKHTVGAGLGLAIVKAIAESHSGHVWVATPDSGAGAIFGISIPAGEPESLKSSHPLD